MNDVPLVISAFIVVFMLFILAISPQYNGFANETTYKMCSEDNMKIVSFLTINYNGCIIKECGISFDGIEYCTKKHFKIVDNQFFEVK